MFSISRDATIARQKDLVPLRNYFFWLFDWNVCQIILTTALRTGVVIWRSLCWWFLELRIKKTINYSQKDEMRTGLWEDRFWNLLIRSCYKKKFQKRLWLYQWLNCLGIFVSVQDIHKPLLDGKTLSPGARMGSLSLFPRQGWCSTTWAHGHKVTPRRMWEQGLACLCLHQWEDGFRLAMHWVHSAELYKNLWPDHQISPTGEYVSRILEWWNSH